MFRPTKEDKKKIQKLMRQVYGKKKSTKPKTERQKAIDEGRF